MPKARLTDIAIKTLKSPTSGQETYWDTNLTGFGVRVSQGGSKSFVVMHGANRRRTTIGKYPIVTLSDARTAAKRILAEQTLGKHTPRSVSFEMACTEYLAECTGRVGEGTLSEYTRQLKDHWLPSFRRSQLSDISPSDIHHRLNRLGNTPSEQSHSLVTLKVFLNWCVRRHYLDRSPAANIERRVKQISRDRVLSDEELKAVWDAADGYPFGAIVRLLILTGQRRSEIAGLMWKHITDTTITLPETKNQRPHTFPLMPIAKQLIEAAPQLNDTYVFPARGRDRPFNGWSKSKRTLDQVCSVEGWTLHDLRRTFSTNLAGLGIQQTTTERLLNHVSGTVSGVAAIYNRYDYQDEMVDALSKWEERLVQLLAC